MKKLLTYLLFVFCFTIKGQFFTSCGTGLNAIVYGVFNDTILNKLIVSGWFTVADGKPYNGLATWDGQKFDSLGSGGIQPVGTRKEPFKQYKGKLYCQTKDFKLQAYDYQSKNWTIYPQVFNGYILDFVEYKNELIIVGDFTKVGSLKAKRLAKFNGVNFDTLPKSLPSLYYLTSAEVYNGDLYVGGNFAGETTFGGVARFDGTNWFPLGNGLVGGGPPEVSALKVYNGKLYIGGVWFFIDGKFNPSCVAWDGNQFINLGTFIYRGGQPAVISNFRVYKNKLYVFGGLDYIINSKTNDTTKTASMAVWNDTIWCKVFPKVTSFLLAMDNYQDDWYLTGNIYMYGDSVEYNNNSKLDTINFLGKFVGNNGKLELNCFDVKPPKPFQIGIYPNPFTNQIKFNLSDEFSEALTLSVYDALGQIVMQFQNVKPNDNINAETLAKGMYLFLFDDGRNRKLFKLLKE